MLIRHQSLTGGLSSKNDFTGYVPVSGPMQSLTGGSCGLSSYSRE